jgi:hypothetical protein
MIKKILKLAEYVKIAVKASLKLLDMQFSDIWSTYPLYIGRKIQYWCKVHNDESHSLSVFRKFTNISRGHGAIKGGINFMKHLRMWWIWIDEIWKGKIHLLRLAFKLQLCYTKFSISTDFLLDFRNVHFSVFHVH